MPRDEPRERPIVVVRPVHHRRDAVEKKYIKINQLEPKNITLSACPSRSSAHLNNGGRCFPAAGAVAELAARHGSTRGATGMERPQRKGTGPRGPSGGESMAVPQHSGLPRAAASTLHFEIGSPVARGQWQRRLLGQGHRPIWNERQKLCRRAAQSVYSVLSYQSK
jgi:hypothetical protein